MPTTLNNQALVSYYYNEEQSGGSAASNVISTTLLDQYGLSAEKMTSTPTYRDGQRVFYAISIVNNGNGALYNVTVVDDLGGGALTYLEDSLQVFQNGLPVTVTPVLTGSTLTVTIPGPLESEDNLLLVYAAVVLQASNPERGNSITNTAAVSANSGSPCGATVSVSPSPSATITAEVYAELAIFKQADQETVSAGDELTYTFTLTNSGNDAATGVVVTDRLPDEFTPTLVQLSVDGITTTYTQGQYTVDPVTNVLTLPADGVTTITVPAATAEGPSVAVITVAGTIES
ncbi:MAG: DUF11 domain-containing protein [Clostridia bacterium]|nr:DUF11 domain-containing protein [Clostridia bacterium]